MAGSLRSFLYETDIADTAGTGFKYIVLDMDEGNAKLLGGEENTPGNRADKEFVSGADGIKRLEPRTIYFQGKTAAGKAVRRKMIAPVKDNTLVKNGGTTVLAVFTAPNVTENVDMYVSGVVGEKRTLVISIDTGLDDGTAT